MLLGSYPHPDATMKVYSDIYCNVFYSKAAIKDLPSKKSISVYMLNSLGKTYNRFTVPNVRTTS